MEKELGLERVAVVTQYQSRYSTYASKSVHRAEKYGTRSCLVDKKLGSTLFSTNGTNDTIDCASSAS